MFLMGIFIFGILVCSFRPFFFSTNEKNSSRNMAKLEDSA